MNYGKEFKSFATKDHGISSTYYDKIISSMYPVSFTPNIIEERQMNIAKLEPEGWPTPLNEVRPGLIMIITNSNKVTDHYVGFKSEYKHDDGMRPMAYNEAGEYLCIQSDDLVQAVKIVWGEE